jgi:hypothetical protein
MEKAMEDLTKAQEHENKMLEKYGNAKLEYENNKLVMGPLYWELYTKFREAEAVYEAAKQAVVEATKIANDLDAKEAERAKEEEAEREYYKNLKCTFCGDLDSICGGDHSFEMRWDAQNR